MPANRSFPVPAITLLLGAAAAVLYLTPTAQPWLEYDTAAISRGEWWRWVTCHWTHFNGDHLTWDLAVFVALGAACESRDRRRFLACVAASALLIPFAVRVALPELRFYRGLSGIDSALFALLAATIGSDGWRDRAWARVLAGSALFLGFLAKVAYEHAFGSTMFVETLGDGVVPVPLAHVVGMAVGVAAAWVPARRPGGSRRIGAGDVSPSFSATGRAVLPRARTHTWSSGRGSCSSAEDLRESQGCRSHNRSDTHVAHAIRLPHRAARCRCPLRVRPPGQTHSTRATLPLPLPEPWPLAQTMESIER